MAEADFARMDRIVREATARIFELSLENERLRAALERIAEQHALDVPALIARCALGGAPEGST